MTAWTVFNSCQVDLKGETTIIGVATQGQKYFDSWVMSFTLAYNSDGRTWNDYLGIHFVTQVGYWWFDSIVSNNNSWHFAVNTSRCLKEQYTLICQAKMIWNLCIQTCIIYLRNKPRLFKVDISSRFEERIIFVHHGQIQTSRYYPLRWKPKLFTALIRRKLIHQKPYPDFRNFR